MTCKFFDMLQQRWDAHTHVCIGLDSDPARLPDKLRHKTGYGMVDAFNLEIIRATRGVALCYKPNIAFYSGRFAPSSLHVLRQTIDHIRTYAPGVPVILDAKRGDIDKTNIGYVEEAFESMGADALTVSPYLGMEAMRPFLEKKDKGIIVLCKTSNKGSGEFQDVTVELTDAQFDEIAQAFPADHDGITVPRKIPFYQYVAYRIRVWNRLNRNCGLVVGATYPEQLKAVRRIVGDSMWLLLPGFGAQGGKLEEAIPAGMNGRGSGIIPNSSSGIIFASKDDDYAHAAYRQANAMNNTIFDLVRQYGPRVDKLA